VLAPKKNYRSPHLTKKEKKRGEKQGGKTGEKRGTNFFSERGTWRIFCREQEGKKGIKEKQEKKRLVFHSHYLRALLEAMLAR